MEIGARLGVNKFYDYFEAFGLYGDTGLDLPGEANNKNGYLVWNRDKMTNVDLAVASFGQRFQVTPIQMVAAFSAVVNGGYLVQPYVVDSITGDNGEIIQKTETTVIRQVIRCRRDIADLVSGDQTLKLILKAGDLLPGTIQSSFRCRQLVLQLLNPDICLLLNDVFLIRSSSVRLCPYPAGSLMLRLNRVVIAADTLNHRIDLSRNFPGNIHPLTPPYIRSERMQYAA